MAFPWMALAQMGIGAVQSAVSASKASELPDPQQYSVSPELRADRVEAERIYRSGTPARDAAFNQMLARQATTTKQMFRNAGIGSAGLAAANTMSVDALNQYAAQSEEIRRQNFGELRAAGEAIQNINNMEVGRQNQRLLMEEQALGGGIQAGISNMFQGLNAGQNMDWMNKAMETYKGQSKSEGQDGGIDINPFSEWGKKSPSSWNREKKGSIMQTGQTDNTYGFGLDNIPGFTFFNPFG